MKKLLATIAAAAGMAAPLMAEDVEIDGRTWTFTTNDVESVITGVSDKGGDVVIPSTLAGKPVTRMADSLFTWASGMTSVTLPEHLKSIGNYTFSYCSGLTNSIAIPGGVTNIGNSAFNNCYNLTGFLAIPGSVENIGDSAFQGCSRLSGVTIGEGVRNIGDSAFYYLFVAGDLVIPDSVTNIGNQAFYNCANLTNLTIGASVVRIGDSAFYRCERLVGALTIPDSVKSIGNSAFSLCSLLDGELTLGAGVTNIGDSAFSSCYRLRGSLTVPGCVKKVGAYAFFNCEGLTGSLTIEDGVLEIWDSAFSQTDLTGALTIPNSVTDIRERAFANSEGFTSLTIGSGVQSIGASAFSNCKGLSGSVTIPEAVTSIGGAAFSYCSGLTNVTMLCGITAIEDGMFASCGSLESVTIPNGVTDIGKDAFSSCRNLANVTIPGSVTHMGTGAFYSCDGLTGVNITDLAAWCRITFDDSEASPLNKAKNLYLNGAAVTELTIPDGVTDIGRYAFSGCTNITCATIGNSVTNIGANAFAPSALETVCVPYGRADAVEAMMRSGHDAAFVDGLEFVEGPWSGNLAELLRDTVVESDTTIYGTLAENYKISVADGVTVTLSNAVINGVNDDACKWAGISCLGDVTIILAEGSANTVRGFDEDYPGIHIATNKTLTIRGAGSLDASSNGYGAGIGCGNNGIDCGNIVIEGGTITATGGDGAAGIGGAEETECGDITITGGIVVATGNNFAADIGTGTGQAAECGGITITRDVTSVTATTGIIGTGRDAWGAGTVMIGGVIGEIDNHGESYTYYGEHNGWDETTVEIDGFTWMFSTNDVEAVVIDVTPKPAGSVVIPAEFDHKPVMRIGNFALANCRDMTGVSIPESVTNIGEHAFNSCAKLAGVTIPDGVTSIGKDAFAYSGLKTVYVSYGRAEAVEAMMRSHHTAAFVDGITFVEEPWNGNLAELARDTVIESDMTIYGTLGESYKLSVADGVTVTLSNAVINGVNDDACKWAGISCLGDATIVLAEGSANTVKGFDEKYPGIHIATNKTLTIRGAGSLDASSNGYGAGIGCGFGIDCGDIVIEGGTITAVGGQYAAGIGSVEGATCGDISIIGGTVVATGNLYAADIGTGSGGDTYCGSITITRTVVSVTATTGTIGSGRDGESGTVTIGGKVGEIDQSDAYTYYGGGLTEFEEWAEENGLSGEDAAWDAKPAKWGGKWANAFIYTFGEGIVDGTTPLMTISFDADGKPVITTAPGLKADFTPSVIGTTDVGDWTEPVELEKSGNDWTLPAGKSANFFRVRLTE